jgi:hypothetical protein
VGGLAERFHIAGLGITEYEPSRDADAALLAELIPALAQRI